LIHAESAKIRVNPFKILVILEDSAEIRRWRRIFKAFRVQLAHAEPPKEKTRRDFPKHTRHPLFHRAFIQRSFFDTV